MKKTITLTDDQIKDVSTPYVIIPATENLDYTGVPTQVPLPITVIIKLDNNAAGYSNIDPDARFIIVWGSDWSTDLMEVRAQLLEVQSLAHIYQPLPLVRKTLPADPDPDNPHLHYLNNELSSFQMDGGLQDNALALVLKNGSSGDLTGGDPLNSLKVTVFYQPLDL